MSLARSWHEQQLLDELAGPIASGAIELVPEVTPLVRRITETYPVRMNRIDWLAVAGARSLMASPDASGLPIGAPGTALHDFWDALRHDNNLADNVQVVVLGDSLVDCALRLSLATLTSHLTAILSIPHHTYVFPEDMAWCFQYTAEDDAFFALRPPRLRT